MLQLSLHSYFQVREMFRCSRYVIIISGMTSGGWYLHQRSAPAVAALTHVETAVPLDTNTAVYSAVIT